jgi:predicted dehydrogenase
LTGSSILPGSLEPFYGECVYVNYAFPFLKTARLISGICRDGRLGEVFRIMVAVSPRFEMVHTPIGWFLDDAVHPLSWLNYAFGDFKLVYSHVGNGRPDIAAILTNGNQTLNLDLYEAHTTRLRFDITVAGTQGVLRTSGGFEPGRFWNFEPVTLNGEAVNEGEFSSPDMDIWFEANCEAVRVFLDVSEGRITRDDALAKGLCDIRKASMIELGLAGMLEKDS